ncbi:hypothetical protein A8B82_21050 [Sulfitobacter sp. EhC04]|uniref:hypothetical protein n=1 Tax=Sulfitobacter sp. EhC04 TaxID=1849168 RepID=UPI0007F40AE1|nr:hypothetical protein [Sulfitobacter sp. EhC04]OAN71264.1 hypothetical protein A8B82_21050 [Sulfitobacter sp. EhC04]
MRKEQMTEFYVLADEAREIFGDSAPKITDEILREAFPKTMAAAEAEGCDKFLRHGAKSDISRYIRKPKASVRQLTFASLDPDLLPLVQVLNSVAYYVPNGAHEGTYYSVPELCHDEPKLTQAYQYKIMQRDHYADECRNLHVLLKKVREKSGKSRPSKS